MPPRNPPIATAVAVAVAASALIPVAQPAVAAEPTLRFATYNVCNLRCGTGQFSWDRRKKAVLRTIRSAKPDVLALQEVNKTYPWFEQRLGKMGYARVQPLRDNCTGNRCIQDSHLFYRTAVVEPLIKQIPNERVTAPCRPFVNDEGVLFAQPTRPTYPARPSLRDFATRQEWIEARAWWREERDRISAEYQLRWDEYNAMQAKYQQINATHNCARFVGQGRYTEAGNAQVSLSSVARRSPTTFVVNRNFTWAVLRDRRTKAAFTAVSLHLPFEKIPSAEPYRRKAARGMVKYLRRSARTLRTADLPMVLMGDLNSFAQRDYQQRGAHWIFGRKGFRDTYHSATEKVRARFPTNNVTGAERNFFPRRPRQFDVPPRLDYVMVKGGKAVRYEVHLRLKPNGDFDNRFRGSDHNLVLSDIRMPRKKPPGKWRVGT